MMERLTRCYEVFTRPTGVIFMAIVLVLEMAGMSMMAGWLFAIILFGAFIGLPLLGFLEDQGRLIRPARRVRSGTRKR